MEYVTRGAWSDQLTKARDLQRGIPAHVHDVRVRARLRAQVLARAARGVGGRREVSSTLARGPDRIRMASVDTGREHLGQNS